MVHIFFDYIFDKTNYNWASLFFFESRLSLHQEKVRVETESLNEQTISNRNQHALNLNLPLKKSHSLNMLLNT